MGNNGSNDARKRFEFLEKVYLEDRGRWRANDERWRANDEKGRANDERLKEMLAEIRRDRKKFEEDFQEVLKVLVRHSRKIEKLEASQDASLRILRRLLEK